MEISLSTWKHNYQIGYTIANLEIKIITQLKNNWLISNYKQCFQVQCEVSK